MKHLLIVLMLCFAGYVAGQDVEKKVINKTIKKEIHKDDHDNMSKSIDIESEIVDGKEVKTYVVRIKKNGEEKVMKWDGKGEMPQGIKDALEGEEEVDVRKESRYKVVEIIEEDDDGSTKVMKWKSGDDMPKEMKDKIIELEVESVLDEDGEGHENVFIIRETDDDPAADVKVRMGIGLDSGENGVEVAYVEEGSPAEKAKILKADVILKIDDQYIFTDRTLMSTLAQYNPGDEIKVTVLRSGKEKKLKLTLVAK